MEKVNLFLKKQKHLLTVLLLIAISAAIIFFCYKTYAEPLKAEHAYLSITVIAVTVFCCLCGILAYVLFVAFKTDKLKTFMAFFILLGVFASIVLPKNVIPDELSHFKTAYAYSNVLMGVSDSPNEDVLLVRSCDWHNRAKEVTLQKYSKTYSNIEIFTKETELIEVEPFFVYTSPFYVYIPQTIGLTLGRLLHLGGTFTYYLARMFNFAFYVLAFYLAIKMLPFGKPAFAVIGLFPIALQQAASLSSDSFINALAFLMLSTVLSFIYSNRKITVSQIISFIILSVLLAPCKVIYFILPLMAILIPKENFTSKLWRRITKYFTPVAAAAALLLTGFGNISRQMAVETADSAASPMGTTYSLFYVFTDPKDFILLLLRTLREYGNFYLGTTISASLASVQLVTSPVLVVIFCLLLFAALIPEKDKTDGFNVKETEKLLSALLLFGTIGLVILSMFSSWTPEKHEVILGVQGRYFLPAILLIIPIAYTDKICAKEDLYRTVMFIAVCTSFYTFLSAFCMGMATVAD